MSSASQWKNSLIEKPKPNFLLFWTQVLSPGSKNGSEESDFSMGKRAYNFSVRNKSESYTDPFTIQMNGSTQIPRKKNISEEELLFGYWENKDLNEKIPLSEFNAINFDNSIPNFSIDLIKYLTGYNKIKM